MKSIVRILMAAFSVVTITACAKSSSEQAKDTADTAITRFEASARAVDAFGTPNSTWTDAQLNQFDAAVVDCLAKADRVEELDGKDGVIITGTWSLPSVRRILRQKKMLSQSIRDERSLISNRSNLRVDLDTLSTPSLQLELSVTN